MLDSLGHPDGLDPSLSCYRTVALLLLPFLELGFFPELSSGSALLNCWLLALHPPPASGSEPCLGWQLPSL